MNADNTNLLDDSVKALKKCSETLSKIADTCCMPERSPNMKDAHSLLGEAILATNETYNNKHNALKCIEHIGRFGKKIGYLYATCCTPARETLYQSIFKDLMEVHGKMWGVLGKSH